MPIISNLVNIQQTMTPGGLRESIKDDYKVFDDTRTLRITHSTGDAVVDAATGKVTRPREYTDVPGCLLRQPSLRNGGSVPQIHQRDVSVQKDSFSATDIVIEVPILVDLFIKDEDTISDPATGEEWNITAIDYTTLKTRYRLGCMKLR